MSYRADLLLSAVCGYVGVSRGIYLVVLTTPRDFGEVSGRECPKERERERERERETEIERERDRDRERENKEL